MRLPQDNVLITPSSRACLADFGLSWAVDPRGNPTMTIGAGALRWQAPEVLQADGLVYEGYTLAGDIYALGCTAYEVELPFP
jgi:serine/threonine protein kinase